MKENMENRDLLKELTPEELEQAYGGEITMGNAHWAFKCANCGEYIHAVFAKYEGKCRACKCTELIQLIF